MHDRFLQANGYSWDRVSGFDPGSYSPDSARVLSADIASLIDRVQQLDHVWLVKDPRLCLLVPHWQAQFPDPAYVVVVRDPREIAASMFSGPRGSFTSPFVIALWDKYLHTLLECLKGHSAIFVDYSKLLEDPQGQCKRILRALRSQGRNALRIPSPDELNGFLDTKLHRSVVRPHMHLSASQRELSEWLRKRCISPGAVKVAGYPDEYDADYILAEFEQTFEYRYEFGRKLGIGKTGDRLAAIESTLRESLNQNRRWNDELDSSRRELDLQRSLTQKAEHALAAKQSEFLDLKLQLKQTEEALAKRELDLSELRSGSEHLREDLAKTRAELEGARATLEERSDQQQLLDQTQAALTSEKRTPQQDSGDARFANRDEPDIDRGSGVPEVDCP